MRLIVSVDDVMIEVDDEQQFPTLEGIESVLIRMAETAFQLYSRTLDLNSEQVFSIDFTPAEKLNDTDQDPDA